MRQTPPSSGTKPNEAIRALIQIVALRPCPVQRSNDAIGRALSRSKGAQSMPYRADDQPVYHFALHLLGEQVELGRAL